jgi:hypothetical protein
MLHYIIMQLGVYKLEFEMNHICIVICDDQVINLVTFVDISKTCNIKNICIIHLGWFSIMVRGTRHSN